MQTKWVQREEGTHNHEKKYIMCVRSLRKKKRMEKHTKATPHLT